MQSRRVAKSQVDNRLGAELISELVCFRLFQCLIAIVFVVGRQPELYHSTSSLLSSCLGCYRGGRLVYHPEV